MYIDSESVFDVPPVVLDENSKSVRQVAADAIAKRRTGRMADELEKQIAIPGLLLWNWYRDQPGAKILPDGVIELPN